MPDPEKKVVRKGPAWRAAEAFGLDMSLVEANLELTPAERIRANNMSVARARAFTRAMEDARVRS